MAANTESRAADRLRWRAALPSRIATQERAVSEAAAREEERSSNREPDGDAELGAPASLRSNEMEFSGERSESAATTG